MDPTWPPLTPEALLEKRKSSYYFEFLSPSHGISHGGEGSLCSLSRVPTVDLFEHADGPHSPFSIPMIHRPSCSGSPCTLSREYSSRKQSQAHRRFVMYSMVDSMDSASPSMAPSSTWKVKYLLSAMPSLSLVARLVKSATKYPSPSAFDSTVVPTTQSCNLGSTPPMYRHARP